MRSRLHGALLVLCLLQAGPAIAQLAPARETTAALAPVEVDVEGQGPSPDAAIQKALNNAIAEQTGVAVAQGSVTEDVHVQAQVSGSSTTNTNAGVHGVLPQSMREKTETLDARVKADAAAGETVSASFSGGRVKSYHVISNTALPSGAYVAKVHVVLELYRRQAAAEDGRKRLAIGTFLGDGDRVLGQSLREQLVIALTQSRRFSVLDRAHEADFQNEIDLITSKDAAPEARSHAGQALGADLLLTGRVHVTGARTVGHAAQTSEKTLELTGEVVTNTTPSTLRTIPGAAYAEFQLIDVATRQVRVADRIGLTGAGVDGLAQQITAELVMTIYPPRLIKWNDPSSLVVSQGGSGMAAGQQFQLMEEGEELFDPYTHESLGRNEQAVGVLEITQVTPRFSYARLLNGAVPQNGARAVLRPAQPSRPAAVASKRRARRVAPTTSSVPASAPDRGVSLPFDRP